MKSQLLTSVSLYAKKCWRSTRKSPRWSPPSRSRPPPSLGQTALMDAKVDQLRELRSISPLLLLPNELLGCIFEWHFDLADRPIKAAFCVAQVCRRWRDAAPATPRLWEKLRIPGDGWVLKDFEGLLRRMISSSGRIASLNLTLHDAALPFTTLPPPSTLPFQHRASLCVLDSPSGDRRLGPALAWFASSPCLERLSLRLSFKVPLLSSSPLPWATLRVLDFQFPIPVFDAMSVLRQTPKLQECSIGGLLPAEEGSHPPPAVTLPELFRLDVSPGGDIDLTDPYEDVFRLLTCPALTRLTLLPQTLDVQVLLDFQAWSKFNLTTLDLSPDSEWSGTPAFLAACVGLEELQVSLPTPMGFLELEFLDFLTRSDAQVQLIWHEQRTPPELGSDWYRSACMVISVPHGMFSVAKKATSGAYKSSCPT
ncbi:hypothetical protein C8R43DRAFT_1118503 [Mycena crocata]|nr:hypothetical protein C8R43DRAFT_1118503 [Mycena crocata]